MSEQSSISGELEKKIESYAKGCLSTEEIKKLWSELVSDYYSLKSVEKPFGKVTRDY